MALSGNAIMINWSDVAPENRRAYYEWHNREHMLTAVAIPGFQRGRRFIALQADRTFLNLYEVDDIAVFSGPDYTQRTARPSDLTRRTTQYVRNAIRGLARVRFTHGKALGAVMMTLRLRAAPGREQQLEQYLVGSALPAVLEHSPEVLAAHFCVTDHGASSVVTPERQGRPTAIPDLIALIEGVTSDALEHARNAHLSESALVEHGAATPLDIGLYQLEMMATHDGVSR
jgi:hypothetical protein